MRAHRYFKLLLAAVLFCVSAVRAQDSIDSLGPLSASLDPRPTINQVSAFVLRHWRERTLGRVAFTLYSKEGLPSKTVINIKPNDKGRWVALIDITQTHPSPVGQPRSFERTSFIAVEVVPAAWPDGTQGLKFLDSHGVEVGGL